MPTSSIYASLVSPKALLAASIGLVPESAGTFIFAFSIDFVILNVSIGMIDVISN